MEINGIKKIGEVAMDQNSQEGFFDKILESRNFNDNCWTYYWYIIVFVTDANHCNTAVLSPDGRVLFGVRQGRVVEGTGTTRIKLAACVNA